MIENTGQQTLSRCSFEKTRSSNVPNSFLQTSFPNEATKLYSKMLGGKETPAELGLGPHGAASATGCTRSFAVPLVRVLSLL